MTLTQILNNKELTAAEVVEKVAAIVAKARKAYGNTEAVITSPVVPTIDGLSDIKYLSDDDKVEVIRSCIAGIKQEAIERTNATEGSVLDVEVARLIALEPALVNITNTSDSAYL